MIAGVSLLGGYLIATARQAVVRPPLVVGQDAVPPPARTRRT
ncbi:hypothetical protein [Deinococcus aquaticus]